MDYNYNVKNDKEKYLMLIPIITLLIILIGGSYAFLEAKDDDNSIVGSNECYTVNYTKGQDISGELNWGTDYTSGKSTDIVMYSDPDCADMTGTLYITTNNTSTMDFSDKAFRYTVVVNNEVVSEGAVDGTANQVIYKNFKLNTSSTTYKVYIWLSSELADTSSSTDETYSGFIHAEAVATSNYTSPWLPIDNSGANAPGYVEGLIPVMYDESTSAWVKADTTSSTSQYGWYDYDAKKWANAVLVKENSYTEAVGQTNKTVSIANESTSYSVYTSSNQGIDDSSSISVFTFTTGASGGTFSFDYSVSSESGWDKFTVTLNGTTIISAISGTQSSTYTEELTANTEYTLQATYAKDSSENSGDDQATISNIVLPSELTSPLTVTASGSYGWTTSTASGYPLKTYTSYKLNDSGNYVLETANNVSAADAIGKYICSDASSTECSEIYQIKSASGNNITSVDVYTTNYIGVRNTYKNATAGTPITERDILAYYVWIPRYKYKVWNINKEVGTDTYDAYTKGIEIVFEVEDATTGTITCDSYSFAAPVATKGQPNETCSDIQNGEGYYTHPAFTFGNDELSGFWMGKFELSSTDQTAANYGGKDRIDLTPRILPDVMSWRYNTVGNFWKVIYDMQTTDNIYGLPTSRTTTDSHMLTNMEWGAVAYLTHSEYGRCTGGENSTCTEVAKNDSGETSYYTNYTGRSSGTGGSSGYTASGTYTYKEEGGRLASTTGNIYGVYDMSGGAFEYVMGNMGTSAGQTTGEYKYYASNAGSNYAYAGFEKYLIPYAYGTTYIDQTAYNRGRLGDATSEVVRSTGVSGGWYGDYAVFPFSSDSWFMRGGVFDDSADAGSFYFNNSTGWSADDTSARASLVLVAS